MTSVAGDTDPAAAAETTTVFRYVRTRLGLAVVCGWIAGIGAISSMQVGAGLAFGVTPDRDWGWGFWGDHWAWRGVWSLVATFIGAFLAGMIARQRGALIGIFSAVPSMLFWGGVAYVGWFGTLPGSTEPMHVPLGYKIIASALAVLSLPVGSAAGATGEGYGEANADHYDARRASLLGVKWYHYLWLPFIIHFMVAQTTWAAMYGFGWVTTWWRAGQSLLVVVPLMFTVALFWTVQLVATGAFNAYSALAGFDTAGNESRTKQVVKYGIGYPLGAATLQLAIMAIHYGVGRIFG